MPSCADLSPEKRFFGLFIGPSGSGKTVAEASFPKPVEFQDFDGRIRGILGAAWITPEMKSQMRYEFFLPKDPEIVTKINQKYEAMMIMAGSSQSAALPQTFVVDSVTNECFAFLCAARKLTHVDKKGRSIGSVSMAGPEDYGFEATAIYDTIAFLKSLPIPNVILSAHVVDVYGKEDPDNVYSNSVVVGEKLSVRDKIGVNIQTHFDHVFRFDKRMQGDQERFFVRFRGGLARTSYAELPSGEIDITGKNFYETMMGYLRKPS